MFFGHYYECTTAKPIHKNSNKTEKKAKTMYLNLGHSSFNYYKFSFNYIVCKFVKKKHNYTFLLSLEFIILIDLAMTHT